MNNIIIGNGINIQYGGIEYTNESIINRALSNLKTNKFSKEGIRFFFEAQLNEVIGWKKPLLGGRSIYFEHLGTKYKLYMSKHELRRSNALSYLLTEIKKM